MMGRGSLLPAAALLAAAAALGIPALAQEAPRFELTLVGGAGFGSRVRTLPAEETRIGNAGLAGLRLGYSVSRSFRLEAGWTHAAADLLSRDPSAGESYGKIGEVDTDAYELDAFYDFGGGSTRGYLGIGAGAMAISPAQPGLSTADSRLAVNVAAGLRQAIGKRFAVRAEGRYRWRDGKTRVGTVLCTEGEECKLFTTNWYSSAELTAGLSWRF
jgi:opacity protein-like surface antigen